METGQIVAFNRSMDTGFIKNHADLLYYLFRSDDCLGEIIVDQYVSFQVRGIGEAYDIRTISSIYSIDGNGSAS